MILRYSPLRRYIAEHSALLMVHPTHHRLLHLQLLLPPRLYTAERKTRRFSASLYVGEVVPESELVVRQTGAPLGVKSRLAAEVAAPPLALSPDGCKGKKSRIARQGKPR